MPAPVEFVVMGAMLPGRRVTRPHLRGMSTDGISGSVGGGYGHRQNRDRARRGCAGGAITDPRPTFPVPVQ